MRKQIKLWLLALLVGQGAGASTPALLDFSFAPRIAALGGGVTADLTGQSVFFRNPAAAIIPRASGIAVATAVLPAAIRGSAVAGEFQRGRLGISFTLANLDYGTFQGRDVTGQATQIFKVKEWAAGLGGRYQVTRRIVLGARLESFQQIGDNSRSVSWFGSYGLYYQLKDSVAVGVTQLHSPLSGQGKSGAWMIGVSSMLAHLPLRLNLDATRRDEAWTIAWGGEIFAAPSLTVLMGINSRRFHLQTGVSSGDFLAGLSGGLCWRNDHWRVVLSIRSLGALGTIQQLALWYRF